MTFLLDTNVFGALSQRKPHRGVERAFKKHTGDLVTASLVVHERPPPFLDGPIAAVAAVNGATVVSGNAAHFEPFEGLRVENWLG
jgi:predicted nucleic acid-binding protein